MPWVNYLGIVFKVDWNKKNKENEVMPLWEELVRHAELE